MNQRFKELLFFLNKNATNLAKELNVSKTAILRILSGENQPSSKVLIPLGKTLNVNINWLLFGVGEMFMDPPITQSQDTPSSPRTDGHQRNKNVIGDEQSKTKDCLKEVERLKKQLKEKDSIIEEKNKQIIEAKDEIIKLLKHQNK